MCGAGLASDRLPRPEVPAAYEKSEKYCGHCGRNLQEHLGEAHATFTDRHYEVM